MALKDLTIDQGQMLEELIESSVSSYIRYDINQKAVIFLPEALRNLSVQKKILIYLLALRGWPYVIESTDISQEAQPKDIAKAITENGSTVRNNLQSLLKDGLILKSATKYSISQIAITRIEDFMREER
ncbi:MAG: hypothetical protein QY322_02170 [bacterium]|nr:MAG: hypothetical protein QY322_02170 [bacterium]